MALRTFARLAVARNVDLHVDGLERLPPSGAVLIACRHYHHLYDALVLLATVPRPLHFLVALDWVQGSAGRRLMESVCRAARWPVVLRPEEISRQQRHLDEHREQRRGRPEGRPERAAGRPAYAVAEAPGYLRRGVAESTALLRAGRALAIFPEAYPNVDPDYTPKHGDEMLPFRPGFARLASLAARGSRTEVAIVPAGLSYQMAGDRPDRPDRARRQANGDSGRGQWMERRWDVRLRFGPPVVLGRQIATRAALAGTIRELEEAVRALSTAPAAGAVETGAPLRPAYR
jgi:putative membrane protein